MMRLDFDRDFLESAAVLVDNRLDELDRDARSSADPDAFGVFDQAEYLTGFGFVACQVYLAAWIARSGVERGQALDRGPIHTSGVPIVAVVNAAANHWKHSAEWSLGATSGQAKQTLHALSSLGVDLTGSYPIANVLHALLNPHQPRFSCLAPFLAQWQRLLM